MWQKVLKVWCIMLQLFMTSGFDIMVSSVSTTQIHDFLFFSSRLISCLFSFLSSHARISAATYSHVCNVLLHVCFSESMRPHALIMTKYHSLFLLLLMQELRERDETASIFSLSHCCWPTVWNSPRFQK